MVIRGSHVVVTKCNNFSCPSVLSSKLHYSFSVLSREIIGGWNNVVGSLTLLDVKRNYTAYFKSSIEKY